MFYFQQNFIFVNNRKIMFMIFFFITGKKKNSRIFDRNVNREKVNVRFGAESFICGEGKRKKKCFFFLSIEPNFIGLH